MYDSLAEIPEEFWAEPIPCVCGHDFDEHEVLMIQTAAKGFMSSRVYCRRCRCNDFREGVDGTTT